MPPLLRVMSDDPPALAPFLVRLTWHHDPYVIDATWSRRDRSWTVRIDGARVDTFPTIRAVNAFLHWIGDDLRAQTWSLAAWRDAHVDVTIAEGQVLPEELRRLGRPPDA